MYDEVSPPLNDEQREGVLGAAVGAFEACGDSELADLAAALRAGGYLTADWLDDGYNGDAVAVKLAVPAGRALSNLDELEEKAFDTVSRAVSTCGRDLRVLRITLALAGAGWRKPPREELPLRLGGRFDRETDPLKVGGFGAVYKAGDVGTGEEVAIKVLRFPGDADPRTREQYQARFAREMELMTHLEHPNLMKVLWFGEEDNGTLWYAMPLAVGSLADRIAEFVDDPNRCVAVLTSICDAVAYLHDRSVVHRDLSPGNVLCMPDGRWVVSDLGLAFDLDRALTQLTVSGMAMGTVGYRPPDAEARMAKEASPQWDIYSLGHILGDMTTGQVFRDRGGVAPKTVFTPAIERATHADASRRFESVREFVDECKRLIELATSWEGPDEKRTRLLTALGHQGEAHAAAHEVALMISAGESVEPFVSTVCDLRGPNGAGLATLDAEDLRVLAEGVIAEMPGSWTPFGLLDDMALFLVDAAEHLDDDDLREQTLVWLLEVGTNWDRWNVQSEADAYIRRLATDRAAVVSRALTRVAPNVLPDDLTWLHPAARPEPEKDDTEPF